MPLHSPIASWRNQKARYNLTGTQCQACSSYFYPKKYVCPCGSKIFNDYTFSGQAKLLSFTQITTPPKILQSSPAYILGLIELIEGPRLIAQIADVSIEKLTIDMPLEATFRKTYSSGNNGIIHYGIKFVIQI